MRIPERRRGEAAEEPTVERLVAEQAGHVIASLVATFRDVDLAEDAFQEAALAAVERWPTEGAPRKPGAWLTTVARRKAIDALRRARIRADAHAAGLVAVEPDGVDEDDLASILDAPVEDERLRLVFTCCHPALPVEARVALTLRLLGGLSTAQVARAFFVSEATMAKRIVRAKKKISEARIPYRVPTEEDLPGRLDAVLLVLYLIFNQGWAEPGEGGALAEEGIRLGRALEGLLPEEPEVGGLLSLMLLCHARRDARIAEGVWVPLEDQDVQRWRWDEIREGLDRLTTALRHGRPGTYQLQASIAAKHAERALLGETPWGEIEALFGVLVEIDPRPVVQLSAALASFAVEGAAVALARLDALEAACPGGFADYQPWYAGRARLLAECGRTAEARLAYRRAIDGAPSEPERRYLEGALGRLG